ncbi:hypothetical protein CMI37_31435 [Candidatus Pacearchaeota archaeon]|nr:hypothetical protein [Candidatus Pacearchaeota archaeon]
MTENRVFPSDEEPADPERLAELIATITFLVSVPDLNDLDAEATRKIQGRVISGVTHTYWNNQAYAEVYNYVLEFAANHSPSYLEPEDWRSFMCKVVSLTHAAEKKLIRNEQLFRE